MKRQLAFVVCLVLAVAITLSLGLPPALAAAPPPLAPIGALRAKHEGQTFQVRARVIDVTRPASPLIFVLDDGTGKIRLRVPVSVYQAIQDRAGLDYGATVQVTARVRVDADGLYLQALANKEFTVLSPGSDRQIRSRPIRTLGKVGVVTAIDGTILSVGPVGTSLYLVVANETGSIRVRLTPTVMQYAPPATAFVPGARIRVVGPVKYSRGPLIEPVLGYHLTLK